MKSYYLVISLIFCGLVSCQSQEMGRTKHKGKKIEPKENIVVNKKYDKNGNLIEFDSTYTSYYSNVKGDTILMDSTIQDFGTFFNHNFPAISSIDLWSTDSVPAPGFFHNDFFERRFMDQDEQMLKMMQRMDSIKNEFFKQQYKLRKEEHM